MSPMPVMLPESPSPLMHPGPIEMLGSESETTEFVSFTVVAYRFGQLNGHQYLVGQCIGSTAQHAIDVAREECGDRGGKYGVAVYGWRDTLNQCLVHYEASLYGEKAPQHNPRLDMFETIGHRLHEAVINGSVSLTREEAHRAGIDPSKDPMPKSGSLDASRVHDIRVDSPAWLSLIVHREERGARIMAAVQAETSRRFAEGLPAMNEEERKAWISSTVAVIDEELKATLKSAAAVKDEPW